MNKNNSTSKSSTKNTNNASNKYSSTTSKDSNKEKSQSENTEKLDKGNSQSTKTKPDKGKSQSTKTKPEIKDPSIPDRSYGDFYCTICDSHMNSDAMWVAHVSGKRHQKSLMKGDIDSKYEALDVESDIKYELRNVKDPIVGLSYIHEIRRKEQNVPPFYSCFLCHATIATIPLVIEHVISMKHRLNYIKENEPSEFELLQATNLKKDHLEPLVQETAMKLEQKNGRGEVLVKQEKNKKAYPMKRPYDDDDDDDIYQRKSAKKDDMAEPSVWKSVSSGRVYEKEKEKTKYRGTEYFDNDHSAKYSSKRSFSRDRRDTSPVPSSSRSYKQSEVDDLSRRYDDYPRRSEHYDYPKRLEYYDDFHKRDIRKRSRSPMYGLKNSHERVRSPSVEPVKKKSYSPVRRTPDDEYLQTSPCMSSRNLLPHEIIRSNEAKNFTDASLKDFLQKILELPTEILLKIFLIKMENMEIKETEELSLLSKIVVKGQNLLIKNLPSELQELVQQKFTNSAASSSTRPVSSDIETKPQSDISFIKDILSSVKNSNAPAPTLFSQQYPSLNQNTSFPNTQAHPSVSQAHPSVSQTASTQRYYQNSYATPPCSYTNNVYNNQTSPPSSIPGLSLTGTENPEPRPYSNYQTISLPSQSYRTNNFSYKY